MSGLLGLELETVNHTMWLLGMGPGSSGRAPSVLTAEPSLQARHLFFEVGSQCGTQASCELLGSSTLPALVSLEAAVTGSGCCTWLALAVDELWM